MLLKDELMITNTGYIMLSRRVSNKRNLLANYYDKLTPEQRQRTEDEINSLIDRMAKIEDEATK